MRKYLILFCVLALICGTVVYARMNVATTLGGSVPAAGGAAPTYIYSNSSGDTYDDDNAEPGGFAIGADVTITQDGDITSVGLKVETQSDYNVKIALYNTSGTRLDSGCTISSTLTVGWNDCSLVSGYAVSTNDVIRVIYNLENGAQIYHHNTGTGYWAEEDFIPFPQVSLSFSSDAGKLNALRLYVE